MKSPITRCAAVVMELHDVEREIEWIVTRMRFNWYERENRLHEEQAHVVEN